MTSPVTDSPPPVSVPEMTGVAALALFGAECLEAYRENQGDLDGFWLQETALECGVLETRTVTKPCNDTDCACAEYHGESEMAGGVLCHFTASGIPSSKTLASGDYKLIRTEEIVEASGKRVYDPATHVNISREDFKRVLMRCKDEVEGYDENIELASKVKSDAGAGHAIGNFSLASYILTVLDGGPLDLSWLSGSPTGAPSEASNG